MYLRIKSSSSVTLIALLKLSTLGQSYIASGVSVFTNGALNRRLSCSQSKSHQLRASLATDWSISNWCFNPLLPSPMLLWAWCMYPSMWSSILSASIPDRSFQVVLRSVMDLVVGLSSQGQSCLVLTSLGDLLLPDPVQNIFASFLGRLGFSTLWLPFFNMVYTLEASVEKTLLLIQTSFSLCDVPQL